MNCPRCKRRVDSKDYFCRYCGAKIIQTKVSSSNKPTIGGLFDGVLRWGQSWLKGSTSSRLIAAGILILVIAGITEIAAMISRGISSPVANWMVAIAFVAMLLSVLASFIEELARLEREKTK